DFGYPPREGDSPNRIGMARDALSISLLLMPNSGDAMSAGHDCLDGADAGKFHANSIARRDQELPDEGAGHDHLASLQRAPVLGKFRRQPDQGIQRVPEHRVAGTGPNRRSVDSHRAAHLFKLWGQRCWSSENTGLLLAVIGQGQRNLLYWAAVFDDFQRRVHLPHRSARGSDIGAWT